MTPPPRTPIEIGAAPIPAGVRSLLVFGGTFDPPHRAHVDLPIAARDRLALDWLLYIPTARNPLKSEGPAASDADRLAMLKAALRGHDRVSISTYELERAGDTPSFTVETLRALHVLLPPGTQLRLLIGADQATLFHRWREPREIIALAEPAVMLRAPAESPDALIDSMRPHWPTHELEAWRARIVPTPLLDISATDARDGLGSDADHPTLERAIPAAVLQIIRERRLYGAP